MTYGNKLRPGFVGVVQITSIEVKPGEFGPCAFTELTVIETNVPEQYWIGQPVVWVQGLKNEEIGKRAFKELLLALGVPEAEMESTINAAIESPCNNALTNRRLRLQTHETQTKNGPFVVHNWSSYAPAESDPARNGDPGPDTAPRGELLRPEHAAYLEQRAVPLDVATAAGLVSVDAARAALLLQLLPEQVNSGGLAIPYPHLEPKFWRVRMDEDEGGAKFMAPPGRGSPIFDAVAAAGHDVAGPLVVSEGPIKALALVSSGICGLGLGGAETGLTKEHNLDPSWESIEIPAEGVVLLPDADVNDNYGVMRGTARLARALTEAHPELTVKLARLPGPGKRGPDDYLAERGAAALCEILSAATPVKPSAVAGSLGELDKDARVEAIARLLEDKFFLVSTIIWGEAETYLIRELFKKGGATKQFDRAIKTTADALRRANRYERSTESSLYRIRNGQFVYVRLDGTEEPLANFTGQVTAEKLLDDGVDPQLVLTIKLTRDNGDDLGEHDVPAREFHTKDWLLKRFGASAIVNGTAGAMAHTCAAILTFSHDKETIKAFTHTGFRRLVDATGQTRLVYLHAGGAIGGEGVTVFVDSTIERYTLPNTTEDVAGAATLSLRMLDVAPDRISCPLFCATYLAPLAHWVVPSFTLWCWGPSGERKTAAVSVAQSHFGDFDGDHPPTNWLSTYSALEHHLSLAKDALTLIDDFVPKSTHELDEMRRTAGRVVRANGNNTSRQRMRSDLTKRPDRPPRGLSVVTGEDQLSGESDLGRTFSVRFELGSVNLQVLSALQQDAHRLPHAMRGYIEYLISQSAWLDSNAKKRVRELRHEFQVTGHTRQPDACAKLMFAAEVFGGYAISIGVFDRAASDAFLVRIRDGLLHAANRQATHAVEHRPSARFLSMLRTMVLQEKIVLGGDTSTTAATLPPGQLLVGWRDGENVLLLPEVYAPVVAAMRSGGDNFPLSPSALWAELIARGTLIEHDQGRTTKKRTVGGRHIPVLVLAASTIDGPAGPPPSAPAAPPASSPAGDPVAGPAEGTTPAPEGRNGTITVPSGTGNSPSVPRATPADAAGFGGLGTRGTQGFQKASPVRGSQPRRDDVRSVAGGVPLLSAVVPHVPSGEKCSSSTELAVAPIVPSVCHGGDTTAPEICHSHDGPPFVVLTDAALLPAIAATVEECVAKGVAVALDTETTGLDPLKDRVRLVQLGLPDGRIYVIDVWATGGLGPVAEVLGRVPWLGHNLKFDVGFMRQLGVAPTKVVDAMLLAQVLDCGLHLHETGYFTLPAVLKRHLSVEMTKDEQKSDWSGTLRREQLEYAARDVQHLHRLVENLATELQAIALADIAALECSALPAIVDMELAGVCFDRERWAFLVQQKRCEAVEAKALVERELGVKNANSTKQVLPVLRQRLGAPTLQKTSAEALAPYAASDPIAQKLYEFRVAASFVKSHGEPLLAAMVEYPDGRVRTNWHQIGAPTGRMASSAPPLLNLPKGEEVRVCVVAAPGCVLICADYSQIELRIAAQGLNVRRLLEIYASAGDVHRATAAVIAGIPEDQVTKEQRGKAKPVNFGFLFGQGEAKFISKALKDYKVLFALDEARRLKAGYLRAYPEIARWQKQVGAAAPMEMRTLGGRIRRFPDRRKGYTERLNMPIQGTAADGFKAAIAILYPRLAALGARIVLAIHDELLVEAPLEHADEVRQLVEVGMIEGMSRYLTDVPVVVEAKIVNNWSQAK